MSDKALILVDFQNEWIDKNSEYFVGDISDVIERTNKLIDICRKNGFKIIFTRHVEEDTDGAFKDGKPNSEIIPDIYKQGSDVVITKNRISPFFKTGLEKELEGIMKVVILGILTNLCVRSAVQDAYDRDLKITVIKDCCVSFDNETQDFTFKDLKATREEIEFLDLENFLNVI